MTLKVRDEEDVLEANLRYHVAQGVDFFVVTDNASTDRTPEILRGYQEAGLLHLLDDARRDYFAAHGEWVSHMARLAATRFAADWVINNDADEFWTPVTGTLKDALAGIPDRYSVVVAPRPEFVPRPDAPGPFYERLTVREARSRLRPKVAHRAADNVVISGGGHDVDREGARPRREGRLSTDAYTAHQPAEAFIPVPRWPIRILHFPHRSFAQWGRRMRGYADDDSFPNSPAVRELRRQVAEGRLGERWEALVLSDSQIEAGVRDGRFVPDPSLRDFMVNCPDPLRDGQEATRAYGVAQAAINLERADEELEILALDVMEANARASSAQTQRRRRLRQRSAGWERKLADGKERERALRRENRKLRRQLDAVTASPWWRLRPRAPQLRFSRPQRRSSS